MMMAWRGKNVIHVDSLPAAVRLSRTNQWQQSGLRSKAVSHSQSFAAQDALQVFQSD